MSDISQKLDLRQSQNLVMTPQLQQAIKLLQLNNLEIAEFIEEEIAQNPLLEKQEKTKDNQFRLSRVLNDLSMVLSECEMFDDALQMAKRAMRLRRRSVGTDHVSICECLNNMGAIYLSRGRFNRAAENFEDAIKVLISGGPEEDPHVAMAYYNLGSTNLFHYCVSFFDFVGCGMLTTSSTWTPSSWPFGADAGSSFSRPGGHQVARAFCMVCI